MLKESLSIGTLITELVNTKVQEEVIPLLERIELLEKSLKEITKTQIGDGYELLEWFVQKFKISEKTFYKYKRLGYVDTIQVGKFKRYKVDNWLMNYNKTDKEKPAFLRRLKS